MSLNRTTERPAPSPFAYAGRGVLVTGASSGIGERFARLLAARGMNLALAARSEDRLRALAAELSARHGVRVHVLPADLSLPGAAADLFERARAALGEVHLLVNNAGFATHGHFEDLPMERQADEIRLNVLALAELTHAALPDMLARGEGGIINVASTAAFQPLPYMAVYGATKAFVLSFSEALWAETRGRGVRVTALCPGATETPFFDVVGAEEASFGRRADPGAVAALGLRALDRHEPSAIHGLANTLVANAPRLLPRRVTVRLGERVTRPRV